jgi:hypothetical protein
MVQCLSAKPQKSRTRTCQFQRGFSDRGSRSARAALDHRPISRDRVDVAAQNLQDRLACFRERRQRGDDTDRQPSKVIHRDRDVVRHVTRSDQALQLGLWRSSIAPTRSISGPIRRKSPISFACRSASRASAVTAAICSRIEPPRSSERASSALSESARFISFVMWESRCRMIACRLISYACAISDCDRGPATIASSISLRFGCAQIEQSGPGAVTAGRLDRSGIADSVLSTSG